MSGVTGLAGPSRPGQAPGPSRPAQPSQPLASSNGQPSYMANLAALLAWQEKEKAAKKLKKMQNKAARAAAQAALARSQASQPAAAAGASAAPLAAAVATAAAANVYDEGDGLGDGVEDESFQAFSTEDLEAAGKAPSSLACPKFTTHPIQLCNVGCTCHTTCAACSLNPLTCAERHSATRLLPPARCIPPCPPAGLRPHPDKIAETSALGAIPLPPCAYKLSLPAALLSSEWREGKEVA